jgi:hypothetical protein
MIMHPDIKEFQTLIKSEDLNIEQVAEASGLSHQTVLNIKNNFDPEAKFRASTVAKVQDFLKSYKRGEVSSRSKPSMEEDKWMREKILTFGEHLDMAIHLCPPTCKLQIILEKHPI